jgi:EAL domain-containing protein (putative c-di-GMP-specific phosphodiesterase class I)
LGLRVISEGVETLKQHRILSRMHCDMGQGYFYSTPLPARSIKPMLEKNMVLAPPDTEKIPSLVKVA